MNTLQCNQGTTENTLESFKLFCKHSHLEMYYQSSTFLFSAGMELRDLEFHLSSAPDFMIFSMILLGISLSLHLIICKTEIMVFISEHFEIYL